MQNVLSRVIECIARTTRYPKSLLTPDADLDRDLGIDSVKRVEIVAALADEFSLTLGNKERDPAIRTIQQVADWIEASLQARDSSEPAGPSVVARSPEIRERAPMSEAVSSNGHRHAESVAPAPTWFPPRHNGASQNGNSIPSHRISPPHAPPRPKHESLLAPSAAVSPDDSLANKVAFVTGSGRGVGRTIARVLAARGATVVVNSFHSRHLGERTVEEIQSRGGNAFHVWGSVANPEHVAEMFRQLDQQLGTLDILVCNASDGRIGSFLEISAADWDRAFHTNVTGHYQAALLASRLMQRRGGGSIVTMSSIASQRYVEGMGGQGVVKAAVESLTRYLACELAPLGIRTNCICGGPVYGDVMEQYPDARRTHNYWESIVPDGELCSPLDLAQAVAFLVSDQARGINGAIWTVDHGASTRAHSRPLPRLAAVPTATVSSLS